MRHTLLLLFCFFICHNILFAQFGRFDETGIPTLDEIFESHYDYIEQEPQEKVYVHLDKPFYSSSETLWFKAYILDGQNHQPTPWSSILYVDLVAENRDIIATKKIKIDRGAAYGEIDLGSDIPTGIYLLRAYTSWMRNFDEELFFNQTIPIYNVDNDVNWRMQNAVNQRDDGALVRLRVQLSDLNDIALSNAEIDLKTLLETGAVINKSILLNNEGVGEVELFFPKAKDKKWREVNLTTRHNGKEFKRKIALDLSPKTQVQFMPEGGYMVNGLRGLVAFKAVTKNGRSIPISGKIVDQNGTEVARFKSEHLGMGSFYLTPKVNHSYTAVLDKFNQRILLPSALKKGMVMRVESISDKSIRVNLKSSSNFPKEEKYIIAQSNGQIILANRIPAEEPEISIKIPRDELPTGIIQFTLFSNKKEPLAERILFNKNDLAKLDFSVDKNAQNYQARDKITLDITSSTANNTGCLSDLSIAVRDLQQVNTDGHYQSSIWRHVLLESEIKGYIENPEYYFEESSRERRYALDLLLLTQGWRRYDLTKTISEELPSTTYAIERGLHITGKLRGAKKEIQNYFLSAFSLEKIQFMELVQPDSSGAFYFPFPEHNDTVDLVLQTTNIKGKKRELSIEIEDTNHPNRTFWQNRQAHLEKAPLSYITATKERILMDSLFNGLSVDLDEVVITSSRRKKYDYSYNPNDLDNRERYNSVFDFLRSKHGGFNRTYEGQPVLFLDARINGRSERYPPVYLIDGKLFWNAEYETLQLNYDINNIPLEDILSIQVNEPSPSSEEYISPWSTGRFEPRRLNQEQEQIYTARTGGFVNEDSDILRRRGTRTPVLRRQRNQIETKARMELTVVNITTKSKRYTNRYNRGLSVHKVYGYATPKEFFQPTYDVKQVVQSQPDTRPTLYWNPQVVTDANGKAQVSFFNSDKNPPMEIIIQGTDRLGRFGTQRIIINDSLNE